MKGLNNLEHSLLRPTYHRIIEHKSLKKTLGVQMSDTQERQQNCIFRRSKS